MATSNTFQDGNRTVTNGTCTSKVEYDYKGFHICVISMNFTDNMAADDAVFITITDPNGKKYNNMHNLQDPNYISFDHWLVNAQSYEKEPEPKNHHVYVTAKLETTSIDCKATIVYETKERKVLFAAVDMPHHLKKMWIVENNLYAASQIE